MSVLLVELAGPQQAWGSGSRFATRATERVPTRSGVIGLLAAALGLSRTDPLDRFDGIGFGVRVDQPGDIERDFQTARSLDGSVALPLSQRYYLADAVFLAGIEADASLVDELHEALRRPRFPLYLGRRAFPPAGPLRLDIVDAPLREALGEAEWRASAAYRRRIFEVPDHLDLYVDAEPGERADLTLQDIPRSFDPRRRRHDWRDVVILAVPVPGRPDASPAEAASASSDVSPRSAPAGLVLPIHEPMLLAADEEV